MKLESNTARHRVHSSAIVLAALASFALVGCDELDSLFGSPVVSISSPTIGQNITGNSVTVAGSATDTEGIISLTYTLSNDDGQSDLRNVLSFYDARVGLFNFQVNDLSDGQNTIAVSATDVDGNIDTALVSFIVNGGLADDFGLVLNAPADGTIVDEPTVTITGTVTAADELARLEWTSGENTGELTDTLDELGSFAFEFAPLVEGANTITFTATPVTGTPVEATLTINYVPNMGEELVVTLSNPTDGAVLDGDGVLVMGAAAGPSDFTALRYALNGGEVVELSTDLFVYEAMEPPTPGEGSGAPDEGSATPDEGSGAPDEGSATPDEGSATPDEGSATPDEGSATPDEGSATPDEGSATPDEGSAMPDEGSATPDEGSATPDEGSVEEPVEEGPFAATFEFGIIAAELVEGENTLVVTVVDADGTEVSAQVAFTFEVAPAPVPTPIPAECAAFLSENFEDDDFGAWTLTNAAVALYGSEGALPADTINAEGAAYLAGGAGEVSTLSTTLDLTTLPEGSTPNVFSLRALLGGAPGSEDFAGIRLTALDAAGVDLSVFEISQGAPALEDAAVLNDIEVLDFVPLAAASIRIDVFFEDTNADGTFDAAADAVEFFLLNADDSCLLADTATEGSGEEPAP
jgi:hypothetical protein